MDYLVKTGEFEGPIHLLLELIQDRKLHVSEVSLAAVTEDFMRYVSERELPYSDVSSFVVVASTLLLIKARSLLPQMELTEEEEASIEDLTERVRQYAIVQKYAEKLSPLFLSRVSFERTWQDRTPVFAPDTQMTLENLKGVMEGIFAAFPVAEKLPEKAMKVVVRLEEVIESLKNRIASGGAFSSREAMDRYKNAADPVERRQAKVLAVVSFLAILEIVKKGFGNVVQSDQFGDIELNAPTS